MPVTDRVGLDKIQFGFDMGECIHRQMLCDDFQKLQINGFLTISSPIAPQSRASKACPAIPPATTRDCSQQTTGIRPCIACRRPAAAKAARVGSAAVIDDTKHF
jgi:hypothetical protein